MENKKLKLLENALIAKAETVLTAISPTSLIENDEKAAATALSLVSAWDLLRQNGTETVEIQTRYVDKQRSGFVADESYREKFGGGENDTR